MGNAANKPIPLILVAGSSYSQRETWICNQLSASSKSAILLEGLPSGEQVLPSGPSQGIILERIASGCFCCAGNMVLRVVLNRLIRQRPEQIFIAISQPEHLPSLRDFLSSVNYAELLALETDQLLI